MNLCRRAALAIVVAVLAGCSLVPDAENVALYQLPETELSASAPTIDSTLKVMAVDSSDALNNRRMLVTEDGASLVALPGARWISPARTLLRARLLECFAADARIARLTSDESGLRADLELHGTLRNFEGDFSGKTPSAYIRFDVTLSDAASRQVLSFRQFRVKVASSGRQPGDMVEAFALASDQLALDMLNWISTVASKPDAD